MDFIIALGFVLLLLVYFLSYLILGIIQPVGAVYRLFREKRLDSHYAIGLKRYLAAVALYFLIPLLTIQVADIQEWFIINSIYTFIIPWAFALWYFRHIRKYKKQKQNIRAYDKLQLLSAPHEDRLLLESYPTKRISINQLIVKRSKALLVERKTKIRALPNIMVGNHNLQ